MIKATSVWDTLTFQEDGVDYLKVCLDVVFYWTGTVFDRVEGILNMYRRSLDVIESDVTFYRTETMTSARRVKKDTFGLVPFWFEEKHARRRIYMLYLESGVVAEAPSDRAFRLQAIEYADSSMGAVRLILPVSTVDGSASAFLDIALHLGAKMKYNFGQAGYSVNWNELGDYSTEAMEAMLAIGRRYPGIDLSNPAVTCHAIAKGIKSVNWLTFLNPEHCERLGGVIRLTKVLGNEIKVHPLPNGIMIQAGPAPEIGDVNRRQNLPLYHRVGRVLAPLRAKDHPPFFGREGVPSEEATKRWLGRFDT